MTTMLHTRHTLLALFIKKALGSAMWFPLHTPGLSAVILLAAAVPSINPV